MRRSKITVLAALLAIVWLAACTTYERQVVPFKMPAAYPNATAVADATIAAKVYDNSEEAAASFGFDIRGGPWLHLLSGGGQEAEGAADQHPGDGYEADLSADPEILKLFGVGRWISIPA